MIHMRARVTDIMGYWDIGRGKPKLFVAKNGKAREYINRKLSLEGIEVVDARAEDIPWIVDDNGKEYFGLTTTEYTEELRLRCSRTGLSEIILPWDDRRLRSGQPTLCLLSKGFPNASALNAKSIVKVAVSGNIGTLGLKLTSDYFRQNGINTEEDFEDSNSVGRRSKLVMVPAGGQLEMMVKEGIADFCLDIVGTGKTALGKYGLRIYGDNLFPIGLSLLANKNYLSQVQGGTGNGN